MVKRFFQNLLGKPAAPAPEVEAALKELVALAAARPALATAIAVLRDALPALYAEPVRETPPVLNEEQAVQRLQGGMPLWRGEIIALDEAAFRARWLAVCAAMRKHQPDLDTAALANAARSGKLQPAELLADVLAGKPERVHARAAELGADPSQAATVFRLALWPVLSELRQASRPPRQGTGWPHGYCWCCGSWPLLGEFRGLEQTRLLRCGLCASEWEFPRSRCPFCGNDDHRALSSYHAEGEESKWRAATCDACHGCVKMCTTLTALTDPGLLIADLATMHLDLVMLERGYGVAI